MPVETTFADEEALSVTSYRSGYRTTSDDGFSGALLSKLQTAPRESFRGKVVKLQEHSIIHQDRILLFSTYI